MIAFVGLEATGAKEMASLSTMVSFMQDTTTRAAITIRICRANLPIIALLFDLAPGRDRIAPSGAKIYYKQSILMLLEQGCINGVDGDAGDILRLPTYDLGREHDLVVGAVQGNSDMEDVTLAILEFVG